MHEFNRQQPFGMDGFNGTMDMDVKEVEDEVCEHLFLYTSLKLLGLGGECDVFI